MEETWSTLALAPDAVEPLRRALRRDPLTGEDRVLLLAQLEASCPAARGVRNEGTTPHRRRYYEEAWGRCGFEEDRVVTRVERGRWPGLTLWVALLHRLLRSKGVDPARARAISQAWLGEHPRLPRQLHVTDLPEGTSLRPLDRESLVTLDAPAQRSGKAPLALLARADATYQEVLAALRRHRGSEGELLLVVRGPDGEPALVPVEVRDLAAPAVTAGLGLRLVLGKTEMRVVSRHGEEWRLSAPTAAVPPSSAEPPGELAGARLGQLQRALWTLHAGKYRDEAVYGPGEDRHQLDLEAEGDLRLGTLVQVLDSVREIPRGAIHPTTPAHVPPGGCRTDRDPRTGKWTYPQVSQGHLRDQACLYDRVLLR
jgi:hypothetical protein